MINKIGIYKITSPSGKIYIGQSCNLEKRLRDYKRIELHKKQRKLYNSLKKYGWVNHIFEIIEECVIELLNEKERYWQDFHDVLNKRGLNCKLTQTNHKKAIHSQETKDKMSKSHTGKKLSEETKEKLRIINTGKKASEETKQKMSKGIKLNWKNNLEKRKEKLKIYYSNRKPVKYKEGRISHLKGIISHRAKYIIVIKDNIIIDKLLGSTKVANKYNLHPSQIIRVCNKKFKKTGGYVLKWETDLIKEIIELVKNEFSDLWVNYGDEMTTKISENIDGHIKEKGSYSINELSIIVCKTLSEL